MYDLFSHRRTLFAGVTAAMLVAGCVAPRAPEPATAVREVPSCQPAAPDDTLIGNWLSVRTQKGVVGELRTLFTLNADGTVAYTEQLKRGKLPSQGLSESGCWAHHQKTLEIQTLESNGAPVNLDDPIYNNRYTILSSDSKALSMQSPDGVVIKARSMSPGYRLPF